MNQHSISTIFRSQPPHYLSKLPSTSHKSYFQHSYKKPYTNTRLFSTPQHVQDLQKLKQQLLGVEKEDVKNEGEEEEDALDQLGDQDAVQIDLGEEDFDHFEQDMGQEDEELVQFLTKFNEKMENNSQIFKAEETDKIDNDDNSGSLDSLSEEEMLQIYNQAAQQTGLPTAADQQQLSDVLRGQSDASKEYETQSDLDDNNAYMDSEWSVNEFSTTTNDKIIEQQPSGQLLNSDIDDEDVDRNEVQMSRQDLIYSEKTLEDIDEILEKVAPKLLKELKREKGKERLGSIPGGQNFKVQKILRIISGSLRGRKLISPTTQVTRPMMGRVRGAVFNMLRSMCGPDLPESSRWLDLYAGTGSVGLEAISRGCGEARFVESDPQVVRKCLKANVQSCGVAHQSFIHTMRVEDFLQRTIDFPDFGGGAFDFVSVCPPYLLVSYPQLFQLFGQSQILHNQSLVFVEYPKNLSRQMEDTLGPLKRLKDKNYGRTLLAVYGPS